ncbi:SDR family oxidoreductase [Nocardioides salsibiostraticola]
MSLPAPAPDRTAVVTGASSGIGVEIARDLSRRGHRVSLVARSADKLESLAHELRSRGGMADVVPADLTDRETRAGLLGRVEALGATVDILVNNAGLTTMGPVSKADPVAEMAMIELDVTAVVDLCARFLPGMVARRRGGILNVASVGGFQPLPGQAGYGACKAFVLSYGQSLAGELKGTGVTSTVLCPGPVMTGFGEAAGFSMDDAKDSLPAAMWVTPEDVAKAAVAGLAKGKMVVVPGAANQISVLATRFAPRSLLVPFLAKSHPSLK